MGDVLEQLGEGELIVVDQSSKAHRSELRALLPQDARLRLYASGVRSLPHARNLALGWAKGAGIVYFDDDVRLKSGCLDAHREALSTDGVGGVVGRITERSNRPNRPAVINTIGPGGRVLTNLDGPGDQAVDSLKGCNMAFRRQALVQAGGFDLRYRGTAFLEDADAAERVRRLGLQLRFAGAAAVHHLSAPAGGVRMPKRVHTWWRFHNTGLFLASHRGRIGVMRGRVTFAAIAVRLALRWRDRHAAAWLLAAFDEGVRAASSPPSLFSESDPRYNRGLEKR